MRVEIAPGALSDSNALSILSLMRLFLKSRHEWTNGHLIKNEIQDFCEKHAPPQKETLAELSLKTLTDSAWKASTSVSRNLTVEGPPEAIEVLVAELHKAAQLIVENHRADKCFVLGIAYAFNEKIIIDAYLRGWLEFPNGGGKDDALAIAESALAKAEPRPVPNLGLLLDSDRMTPSDLPTRHETILDLVRRSLPVHVLIFREAENYVPNKVLIKKYRYRPEAARKIAVLKTLTSAQRGYFDMKKGFKSPHGDHAEVPARQKELYAGLSGHDVTKLKHGFGSNLTETLEEHARDGKVTAEDFAKLGSGVREELRSLLNLVISLI
jgi:hypothetical protein